MEDKEPRSLDILGIKPIGDSIHTIVKGTVEGAAAFLSRICLPASEEFGLLLKDKVSQWRAQNLVRMTEKAERKLRAEAGYERRHTHPRLMSLTLEHSSWIDADEVQEMWAGLLASSCTKDGQDESNLIFINLLSQLTTAQVKVLNYSCEKAGKKVSPAGLVTANYFFIALQELQSISGVEDLQRLDRELDHLRAMNLIRGGFDLDSTDADATPTALALHLYVRCQGSLQSPAEYFGLTEKNSAPESQQVYESSPLPADIFREIDERPPFQRPEAAQQYIGLRVKWTVAFSSVELTRNNSVANVWLRDRGDYPWVYAKLSIADYPEIKTMAEGKELLIYGTIQTCEDGVIILSNAKITSV